MSADPSQMAWVQGRGPKPAKILILGEAPGAYEEQKGFAFVGPAGLELDSWLIEVGAPKHLIHINNVVPIRPPKNDILKIDLEEWRGRLDTLIEEVNPEVIICLGETALNMVTGISPIGKWRGSILRRGGRVVIPTFHPAFILRGMAHMRWVAMTDLRKALKELESPHTPKQREFIIEPTLAETMARLEDIADSDHFTVDIETQGDLITCIGLTNDPSWAICIPLIKNNDSYWQRSEEELILKKLSWVFQNIPAWGQYLTFDLLRLRKFGLWGHPQYDSQLLHACLWPEFPHSLEFLVSMYTNEPYYKDERKGVGGNPSHGLWVYNCKDVAFTDEVIREELLELKERGLEGFYQEQYQKIYPYALSMQENGVLRSKEKISQVLAVVQLTVENVDRLIRGIAGEKFNPRSPKQKAALLYEELKFPVQKNRKTGRITTDDDALRELMTQSPHPILELLIRAMDLQKAMEFLKASSDADGRWRSSWNIGSQEMGRWSATKNAWGTGVSLHTIPRSACLHYPECKGKCPAQINFRSVIVADPGYIFVMCDQIQAEAIIVAALADEAEMFRVAQEGSIHRLVASMIFEIPFEQVSKSSWQYAIAKACVHGSNYDMGVRKFAQLIGRELEFAQSVRTRYHALFPGIQNRFHKEAREKLRIDRKLINALGRERIFLGRLDDETYRKAYAFIPQSTVSDINKRAIPLIWSEEQNRRVVIEHHDANIVQCLDNREAIQATVRAIQEAYKSILIKIGSREFSMGVEIKIGHSWGEAISLETWNAEEIK